MSKLISDDHDEDEIESDMESDVEDEFVGLDEDIMDEEDDRFMTARKRVEDFLEEKRLRDELDDFLDH